MSDTFEISLRIGDQVTTIASGHFGGKILDLDERADRELIAAVIATWVETP